MGSHISFFQRVDALERNVKQLESGMDMFETVVRHRNIDPITPAERVMLIQNVENKKKLLKDQERKLKELRERIKSVLVAIVVMIWCFALFILNKFFM